MSSTVFEEIKERIDLTEIIGRTVGLKRVGHSFRGLCPFHHERTPSFYVRPETNRWHCFGCSKRGDVFDWYVEQGIDFKDAFKELAQIAGVTLDDHTEQQREHERRLREIFTATEKFYKGQLLSDIGRPARLYLRDRGLTPETWDYFWLGYARNGRGLSQYLENQGFTKDETVEAGLVTSHPGMMSVDFFRNRIVFPIWNQSGKTIAFGGRALSGSVRAKYLNTRETPIFRKHEVLYGINLAAKEIVARRQAVIVEGYIDVMTAHQHGETNVVATLGTAISEQHVKRLAGMADEIVLALDADKAGEAATWRSLQKAEEVLRGRDTVNVSGASRHTHTCDLKIMQLPAGQDPDVFIRHHYDKWKTLERKPVVDYALDRIEQTVDLDSAASIEDATRSIANVLVWVSNPVVRARYIQRAADVLDVDELDIRESLRRTRVLEGVSHGQETGADAQQQWEDYALALLCVTGEPLHGLKFLSSGTMEFANYLVEHHAQGSAVPDEFAPVAHRIAPLVNRLLDMDLHERQSEFLRTRLVLNRLNLFAQRAELLSVLGESGDATERATLAKRYDAITDAIRASDAENERTESSGMVPA